MSAPCADAAPDSPRDAEKREALVSLRDRYVEARDLGSTSEEHANLEWILGARRNPTQDPLGFETKTIELVALWLQDLAVEVDRRAVPLTPEIDPVAAHQVRQAMAQKLRDATERFLTAFRR